MSVSKEKKRYQNYGRIVSFIRTMLLFLQNCMANKHITIVEYPLYSPDLASHDFFISNKLNSMAHEKPRPARQLFRLVMSG